MKGYYVINIQGRNVPKLHDLSLADKRLISATADTYLDQLKDEFARSGWVRTDNYVQSAMRMWRYVRGEKQIEVSFWHNTGAWSDGLRKILSAHISDYTKDIAVRNKRTGKVSAQRLFATGTKCIIDGNLLDDTSGEAVCAEQKMMHDMIVRAIHGEDLPNFKKTY